MGTDFEMFPNLTNLSLLLATLLLLLTLAKGEGKDYCCKEKMVGTTNYTLQPYNHHHLLPLACLDNCVYTVANTSTPKYCFEKGDLLTECLSDQTEPTAASTPTTTTTPSPTPTTTTTTTTTTPPPRNVTVVVDVVKVNSYDPITDTPVQLIFGDETMDATTDSDGRASFAISSSTIKHNHNHNCDCVPTTLKVEGRGGFPIRMTDQDFQVFQIKVNIYSGM